MLAGIEALSQSEIIAFAKEANVFREGASPSTLRDALHQWMKSLLGIGNSAPPEVLEQSVLTWLGQRLDLTFTANEPLDQMETLIRRKIAEDAYSFLFPFLTLGSAVTYLGPAQVIGPKLELIEAISSVLIPSTIIREHMKSAWQARSAEFLSSTEQPTSDHLLELFSDTIALLRQTSLETRLSILALNHTVALSDGRYEQPEELFIQALAEALGIEPGEATKLKHEVTETFWRELTLCGGGTYRSTDNKTSDELSTTMRAAQLTLEAIGGLTSLSEETEQLFAESLHHSLQSDPGVKQHLKQGGAFGLATGMFCYIKERWQVGDRKTLLRLSLAAITRQHLQAIGDKATITSERLEGYLPERKVNNVANLLGETAVGKPVPQEERARRISLDPS